MTRSAQRVVSLQGTALLALACLLSGCSSWWDSEPEAPEPSVPPSPVQTPVAFVPVPELFVDPEAEPDEGPAPLTAKFKANVEDNFGPVDCEWDFGDGSPKQTGLNPTHTFERKDDYEVTVICKDSEGLVGESEIDIFVD